MSFHWTLKSRKNNQELFCNSFTWRKLPHPDGLYSTADDKPSLWKHSSFIPDALLQLPLLCSNAFYVCEQLFSVMKMNKAAHTSSTDDATVFTAQTFTLRKKCQEVLLNMCLPTKFLKHHCTFI